MFDVTLNRVYFEGVCFKLTSSWPPARVKWGWELRLLRHFAPMCAKTATTADVAEFRELSFCAQARYLRAICSELDLHFGPEVIPSSPWEPRVPQMAPRSPKGAKGGPK